MNIEEAPIAEEDVGSVNSGGQQGSRFFLPTGSSHPIHHKFKGEN